MAKTGLIAAVVVIIVVIAAAAAYLGTQPVAPTTTPPTTTTPTTTTPTTTTPVKQLKVAWICSSPSAYTSTFSAAQYEALLRAETKYEFVFEFSEGVVVPEGERVGRSYADRGSDIILFSSWFPDAVRNIAKDYPEVILAAHGAGTELHVLYPPPAQVPPNVGHIDIYVHESAYLGGYLAGKMSETGILGILGQYPGPSVNRYFNSFIQGAKEANEDVIIKSSWLYSWYDPTKAKEAVISLIEAGADIIYSDASGAQEGAAERNVYFIASQMVDLVSTWAPDVTIAGGNWILDPVYDDMISGVLTNAFEPMEYYFSMPDGGAEFEVVLPDEVPSDVLSTVDELKRRIIAGELLIPHNIEQPEKYWGL